MLNIQGEESGDSGSLTLCHAVSWLSVPHACQSLHDSSFFPKSTKVKKVHETF